MQVQADQTSGHYATGLSYIALWLFLLGLAVGVTQWEAQALGFQAALGQPLLWKFYNPISFALWAFAYYHAAPEIFSKGSVTFGVVAVLAVGAQRIWLGAYLRRLRSNDGLHGTAHFATKKEIEKTGLLPRPGRRGSGVYCGAWRDRDGTLRALRHDGPEHVLAIAPTRSGKGVSLVIPTLLSWPNSVVINDQKGELFQLTSGWRSRAAHNKVLRFAPGDPAASARFNPLAEVRWETIYEVGDVQNAATIIVDPEGKGATDHWSKTAHALITGLTIHLHYTLKSSGQHVALPHVAAALSAPQLSRLWEEMRDNQHLRGEGQPWLTRVANHPHCHPTVRAAASDMMNRAEAERSGVLSTAMSFLSIYRDPIVAKNVSGSDFTINDLMNLAQPLSLYIEVRPEDEQRMRPLMRLMINQMVEVLMRPVITFSNGRPLPPHKHRLLMMLDEFPSYKRMPKFEQALAVMAGFGIKAYLIIQDIAQLQASDAYGREEAITSNCHVQVAFQPNKIETAEWISRNLGRMTVTTEQISYSGRRWGGLNNMSRSFHQTGRALLEPAEVKALAGPEKAPNGDIVKAGALLVSVAGHSPILGEQSLYFLDETFQARASMPPATQLKVQWATTGAEFDLQTGEVLEPTDPDEGDDDHPVIDALHDEVAQAGDESLVQS